MINRKIQISIWITYILVLLGLIIYGQIYSKPSNQISNPNYSQLLELNNKTASILEQLVKTKFFRILRLKINSDCPLPYMNKLCKSKSCSVCRCDEKDIPQNWIRTDRVDTSKFQSPNKQVWSNQRDSSRIKQWVWHVEDQQNDKGQYFDVNTNIQSFSGYNGSYIWSLIYRENCFQGENYYKQMCRQQKLFYQIISGLHTSISTHLSRYYKNITTTPEWADTSFQKNQFYFNKKQYKVRVLNHPERVQNLLFLYELLIRSIKQISPYLLNYNIVSDNISDDLKATHLMGIFINLIKSEGNGLGNLSNPNYGLFSSQTNKKQVQQKGYLKNYLDDNQVKQYQKYFHNISQILNCVQCEKCRLFGKMQTYGLGTSLKILLGYNQQLKRNQLVALFNTLNKVSISVNTFFENQQLAAKKQNNFTYAIIWGSCGLTLIVFILVVTSSNSTQKINKKFNKIFKGDFQDKIKGL